jgi:hypothetical protein
MKGLFIEFKKQNLADYLKFIVELGCQVGIKIA